MAQIYRRLNSIVIKNAIHSLDKSYPLAEEDSEFLTTYLYAIESWTWFELYIFCNTMLFWAIKIWSFYRPPYSKNPRNLKN